jgi:exodeoxyribonuclease X
MIRVIDFETTGLPPDADVVEAAHVDVDIFSGVTPWIDSWVVSSARPVTPEARAAHHITDKEISNGKGWGFVRSLLMDGSNIYCAHNADFEKSFFNPEGSRWIDTYKCALRLWPEAPRHTNSVLRYFLEGCDPGEAGMPPHRALPDCHVTARILIKALSLATVEQLIAWSDEPPLLPRVPMGKHFGKPWSEVPTDYLEWATRQDFDGGVAHTVRVELAKRRKG